MIKRILEQCLDYVLILLVLFCAFLLYIYLRGTWLFLYPTKKKSFDIIVNEFFEIPYEEI